MEYQEVQFTISPNTAENIEILTAWLSELPFDSFSETETGLNAYAPTKDFEEATLRETLAGFTLFDVSYKSEIIADQNWNKVWEENYFEPIVIADQCLVRSSFHTDTPKVKHEILIDPKMSFGSGHHATTKMMLELILTLDFEDKDVLDMGCGTGILAILAEKLGAKSILGIDIDEWAYENVQENVKLNNTPLIESEQGDASKIGDRKFDIIFANINRNILLQDMEVYRKALTEKGQLLLSGFYTEDKPLIEEKARALGFVQENELSENNWCSIQYRLS